MRLQWSGIVQLVAILLLLFGCKTKELLDDTIQDFETADLIGVIYESANAPSQGAVLTVASRPKDTYVSDINGRVVVNDLSRGIHHILISKEGYRSQEISLEYTSRKQVLYVRLVGQQDLLDAAEEEMDRLEWAAAAEYLESAAAINPENSRLKLLRGAFAYLTGDFSAALKNWIDLYIKGHRESYLYLMIADCYQYGLNDDAAALNWLDLYLESRSDAATQERREELARAIE